jgi:hypothetical protein
LEKVNLLTVWLPSSPYSSSITVTSSATKHCTLGVTMAQSRPAAMHRSNIWLLSFWAFACRRRASYREESCALCIVPRRKASQFCKTGSRVKQNSGTKVNTRLASPSAHGSVVADVNLIAGRFERYHQTCNVTFLKKLYRMSFWNRFIRFTSTTVFIYNMVTASYRHHTTIFIFWTNTVVRYPMRWFLNLPNPSGRTRTSGSLSL